MNQQSFHHGRPLLKPPAGFPVAIGAPSGYLFGPRLTQFRHFATKFGQPKIYTRPHRPSDLRWPSPQHTNPSGPLHCSDTQVRRVGPFPITLNWVPPQSHPLPPSPPENSPNGWTGGGGLATLSVTLFNEEMMKPRDLPPGLQPVPASLGFSELIVRPSPTNFTGQACRHPASI